MRRSLTLDRSLSVHLGRAGQLITSAPCHAFPETVPQGLERLSLLLDLDVTCTSARSATLGRTSAGQEAWQAFDAAFQEEGTALMLLGPFDGKGTHPAA